MLSASPSSPLFERDHETQVLVVGAGPVGMITALDLAARGIRVLLVERHGAQSEVVPKTNHLSSNTLEFLRRLGLAAEIRQKGLPDDYPNDVAFVTTLTGYELARLAIPCRNDRYASSGYIDAGWPTPEPPHRCNQMYFEPVLRRRVLEEPDITVLFNTEITHFVQDETGVTATGRDLIEDIPIHVRADYLIGCEGGRSMTRKAIGAVFNGIGILSYNRMIMIRSEDLMSRMAHAPAWMTWFMAPTRHGSLHAIDGKSLWCFTFTLPAGQTDLDQIEPAEAIRAAVGADIDYQIVQTLDWVGRRLVADKFSQGRAFTAGDASHIWVPMAGYGMNAGVADAMNLTWKMAAVLKGWADPGLLETYGPERMPVTEQVSKYVAAVATENYGHDIRRNPPPALYETGPEGERMRADAGAFLIRANLDQFNCIGLNFGAAYDGSPIVAHDGTPAPDFKLGSYLPSTVPGVRLPHLFLADGSSLYDHLGEDFSLVRLRPDLKIDGLVAAAQKRGLPLTVVDLDPALAGDVYDHSLILVRPDRYIAWRGDAAPTDSLAIVDLVRGAPVQRLAPPFEASAVAAFG